MTSDDSLDNKDFMDIQKSLVSVVFLTFIGLFCAPHVSSDFQYGALAMNLKSSFQ